MIPLMKHLLPLALLLCCVTLQAQKVNTDLLQNVIRFEYGLQVPLQDGASAPRAAVHYTRYFAPRFGVRGGVAYTPGLVDDSDIAALPLAFVYRTGTASWDSSVRAGAQLAAYEGMRDWYYRGDRWQDIAFDMFSSFLVSLFRRAEVSVGFTPGYVFGDGYISYQEWEDNDGDRYRRWKGMMVKDRFAFSLDAGFSVCIPVWRLSLNVSPGIHYFLTDNFRTYDHTEYGPETSHTEPSFGRWQFTLGAGISYLF